MRNKFNIKRFQSDSKPGSNLQPAVCIPTKPFRINPSNEARAQNVWTAWIDKQCYLVDEDVKQDLFDMGIPVWRTNLYEGVRANGQRIVVPIAFNSDPDVWMRSGIEMIYMARENWVTRRADNEHQRHVVMIDHSVDFEPEWGDDFLPLIEEAFGDRIITADHPLLKGKSKSKPVRSFSEIEDEFV